MRGKVQRGGWFRRVLLFGGVVGVWPDGVVEAPAGVVSGRITMLDKGKRPAEDIGQAVVWLTASRQSATAPVQVEISTAEKQFSPHVMVVPAGSTISFTNHDPFNHNVFSLSEENPFDLGLYGRGEVRSVRFPKPGIMRIYCNVHAQMSALVVVRDNPYFAQPGSDGSFSLSDVPPGTYQLHGWHERAPEVVRSLTVPAGGLRDLALQLDARGYKFKPHLNKFGQPYPQKGRRY